MKIKPAIYEDLTPQQRLSAVIEALARGDEAEQSKLTETCPKRKYEQPDYHYSGTLQGLLSMAMSYEQQYTSSILSVLISSHSDTEKADEIAEKSLQSLSNLYYAWNAQMEEMGIDPEALQKLIKPTRHMAVSHFLDHLPEPEEDQLEYYKTGLADFFANFQNTSQ